MCTGVCVSVLIPHPPEMSVDYVQALYWYTTAVVVTNYETETAVYQYTNKMHHSRYSSMIVRRLQSAVSAIPL